MIIYLQKQIMQEIDRREMMGSGVYLARKGAEVWSKVKINFNGVANFHRDATPLIAPLILRSTTPSPPPYQMIVRSALQDGRTRSAWHPTSSRGILAEPYQTTVDSPCNQAIKH